MGLALKIAWKLPPVQNAAMRLLSGKGYQEHVSLALKTL